MNTKQHALDIFEKIKQIKPTEVFDEMSSLNSGMQFILVCLHEAESEVYAFSLSEKMKISRARVAILLKKLLAKNFITKQVSPIDARKEVIKITPLGIKQVEKGKERCLEKLERLIEKFGIEKINTFVEISNEIKNFVKGELK